MHRLRPAGYAPRILATNLSLLQVGELPEMVYRVQVANLDEPGAHSFHHLAASLKTPAPMCLPLEEVARVESVGAKLEETTQLAGRCGGPEAELLHQRRLLVIDQSPKLAVKFGEFGVMRNGVQRAVVSTISLVFPNVD